MPQTIELDQDTSDKKSESQSYPPEEPPLLDVELDFPDGGLRAWLVVFGAFCATFSTFGYINTFAVFQEYYQNVLMTDVSPSKIALIGSLQDFIASVLAVFVGRLFDIGIYRVPLFLASVLLPAGTIVLGQCQKYWQVMLCQGVVMGFAMGCIFGPALPVVSHWFLKRRSTALGIVVSGMSAGGAVLPIVTGRCISKFGFPWAMRITGFILLLLSLFINLFMRRRLQPVKVSGGVFNWKAFTYPPFTCYIIAAFIGFLGILTPLTYIDVSGTNAGVSPSFAAYFPAIVNGAGVFGRISVGLLADKIGCLTVMIPMTAVTTAVTFAWPFAKSTSTLIVVSVVYGFASATFLGLLAVPLIRMGETADVGRRSGMAYTVVAFAALAGSPISGAIVKRTGEYIFAGVYAGCAIAASMILMWITRYLLTGGIFTRSGKF